MNQRQYFDPHIIQYLVSHNPPTLTQLNSFSITMIYEDGYLLAEYIILNWRRIHFVNLILINGNLQQVLGMNATEFQGGWFAFVAERYDLKKFIYFVKFVMVVKYLSSLSSCVQ